MRCIARKKNKRRCKANAIPGSNKCIFHGGNTRTSAAKISADKGSTSENRFVRRQMVSRGSKLLAPTIKKAGYAAAAWGGAPRTPPKYIRSTLQRKHNVKHKGVDYSKPLRRTALGHENPHGPRYGYNTSYKTKARSPTVRFGGHTMQIAGRLLPVFGTLWALHDISAVHFGSTPAHTKVDREVDRTIRYGLDMPDTTFKAVQGMYGKYQDIPLYQKLLIGAILQ